MAPQDPQGHLEKELRANRDLQVYRGSKERRVIRVYKETQVLLGHLEPQDLKEIQGGTALVE